MKIYTGSGDRGMTSLFSGERVKKDYTRVEAFGDVDELNSYLGLLAAVLPDDQPEILQEIRQIQSILFHLGSWLATSPGSPTQTEIPEVSPDQIEFIENAIDRIQEQLPSLKGFILPGGHITAGLAHVARTVCRKAERHVLSLSEEYRRSQDIRPYQRVLALLNRLSDYLFVLARHCNRIQGIPDTLWKK